MFYRFRTYHPEGDRVAHGHVACLSRSRTEPGTPEKRERGPKDTQPLPPEMENSTHMLSRPGGVSELALLPKPVSWGGGWEGELGGQSILWETHQRPSSAGISGVSGA